MAIGTLLVIMILLVIVYIFRPKGEEINIRECIQYTAEGLGFQKIQRNHYKSDDLCDVDDNGIDA